MKLAENLKQIIGEKGLSVSQIARGADIPVQTIHNWLSGQSPKSLEQVKKLSDYLLISIEELCFGVKEAKSAIKEFENEINAGTFEVILRRRN